ncbi:MAG: DUF4198 domain-containing protein [Gemmatimonadaceae bacterium]
MNRATIRIGHTVLPGARRPQVLRGAALVAALLFCSASLVKAHDFWLIPDAFAVTPGGRLAVNGQTSSLFPTSLSAATPDRIVKARVFTADSSVPVRDISVVGASLRMSHPTTQAGQRVVSVQLAPRSVRESPASFLRYLDLEGAPEARVRYDKEGLLPRAGGDSITRRYAKYAKTVVEVGRGPRAFQRVVGHPLEFVPLTDPASLRTGDTLRVRLLLLGKPAAFARFHAGSVGTNHQAAQRDTTAARSAAADDVAVETDGNGVATVVIVRPGVWNVRTLQIVPAARKSGADWDVHWATLVFAVSPR